MDVYLNAKREQKLSLGFVPTMGALHRGHLYLLDCCKAACDVSVVSIFVNPTQFNDKDDLEKYPRTIDKDIRALEAAGCDILFYPDTDEVYPPGEELKRYELGRLEEVLEGAFRPGHFQGVCQVVDKLFAMVRPDEVFFGQKDYQQCMVIRKLLELVPGFGNIKMNIIPTLRESSGLAMSSRNMRLSEAERELAATIHQTLLFIKQHIKPGELGKLVETATVRLQEAGFVSDYIAVADAHSLELVSDWDGSRPLVALIAAFLGKVRLIDNLAIA